MNAAVLAQKTKPRETELAPLSASVGFSTEPEPAAGLLAAAALSASAIVTGKNMSLGLSRDEMNLAEFPLTVLSTRADPKVKTLEFSDTLRLKNGDSVERRWIITGADKFGLPTSTDDDVILGLIRLSMSDGFRNRKVYFSRYELLKALRWSTEGRSYSRLTKSLDRLSGVRIRATNSFYDNSSKSYQTCNFGIIDAYEINDRRVQQGGRSENLKSFFIWSEMIFDSFRAGFIKKLDLDLYFDLKSAVSRRLYRYLDKHFYYKSVVEKPLMLFAFEKLGLSRSYRYVSSIRQQLEPAIEELIKVGFLSSCEISGKGEQASIRFIAKSQSFVPAAQTPTVEPRVQSVPVASSVAPAEPYPQMAVRSQTPQVNTTLEALVSRGITIQQAKRLLESKSETDLKAIERIILYYDHLVESKDPKVSRSKVGFLYRAVESPFKFNVPAQFESPANGAGEGTRSARTPRPEHLVRKAKGEKYPVRTDKDQSQLQSAYKEFLEVQLASGVRQLGAGEIDRIRAQVEKKMDCLKSALSGERFQEALNGCVKEELVKVLGLPDFPTYCDNKY